MPAVAAVSVRGKRCRVQTSEPQYLDPAEGLVNTRRWLLLAGGGAWGPRVRQRSVFRSPLWHQRWEAEVGRFNSCSVSPCVLHTSCSDRGRGGGGGGRIDVNICCSACQASGAGMEHLQAVLEYWWEHGGEIAVRATVRSAWPPASLSAPAARPSVCLSQCLTAQCFTRLSTTPRLEKINFTQNTKGLVWLLRSFFSFFYPSEELDNKGRINFEISKTVTGRITGLKGTKMKMLSSFTHPQVVPNCWTQRKIFWRMWETENVGHTIDFHSIFSYYGSQWCPKTGWLQTLLQNIFLCVRQNKDIHTGLELLEGE